jgi:predicted branched-subunit amino acid permease
VTRPPDPSDLALGPATGAALDPATDPLPEAAAGGLPPFREGLRDGLPFLIAMAPFGLLFGVASAEAGLGWPTALAFSVAVLAGTSQFTALSLMSEGAPAVIVLVTALAVNLRMAMYSAALAPSLGGLSFWRRSVAAYALVDASYACAEAAYARRPAWSPRDRFLYFLGAAYPLCPLWFGLTILGAVLGAAIPSWLALDFAVPICFIAMVAPGLRTAPQALAAGTSVAGALLLAWMPYGTGLLVAAGLAMAVGAEAERRLEGRA